METNRFSKQLYTKVVVTLLALFPVVLLALILIIVAIASAAHFNSADYDVMTLTGALLHYYLYALGVSWFFGLLVAFFGRTSYKTYAMQVIDYDKDEVEVKKIAITDRSSRLPIRMNTESIARLSSIATMVFA